MENKYIISVDMGGTKMLASVINSNKGIISRAKISTDLDKTPNDYVKDIASLVKTLVDDVGLSNSQIVSVCLGVPGSVNPYTGHIGIAPNLGIKNFNIKNRLEKILPYKVLIENDVNLGALGIKHFGVGKNVKNLLAVFIGTGIGGGVIINGEIYRGSNFVAGEIGHMLVDKNGPKCGCGRKGCFEALASRTAIVNNIIKDVKKEKKKSLLEKQIKANERIKSKALLNAVLKGDKVVINRMKEAAQITGQVLSGIQNLMNFDMIVLGGGVIEAVGKFYLPLIEEEFYKHALYDSSKNLKIVQSKLGDDAAIYGGIALTKEFLGIAV
ncbi:Sugar kinase [Ignavibacterium album JCM 16511]|uniref:Sugar kinase n=1 Tax=Ignavibacterium album (strain DSM 19864 / JCM 16511 / NBRC 101810 / Mat9-16) TaxID=945713 RepID=I0AM45_IGNAJ|nr:ROK family protein [Ignavibacterium album]AFH50052.1 Sugar kinase [Ignavibacterium album JCM 16511]